MRDQLTKEHLSKNGIQVFSYHDQCVVPPGEIATADGKPFQIYSKFRPAWLQYVKEKPISLIAEPNANGCSLLSQISDDIIPKFVDRWQMKDQKYAKAVRNLFPAGSKAARKRLEDFVQNEIGNYAKARDFPAQDGACSALSPYLAIGSISLRQCLLAALESKNQDSTCWIFHLGVRDFFRHVAWANPKIYRNQPMIDFTQSIRWENDPEKFERWCRGQTGYPFVDAAMRQLNSTGWLSNRMRQVAAFFLVKDLLIDWRWGEAYFMAHLVDGDFASNNAGWQWCASTGNEAAPYLKLFDPVLQSKKYDPEACYIKRWVEELSTVPSSEVAHEPWNVVGLNEQCGYVERIVIIHDEMVRKVVEMYKNSSVIIK